MKIKKTLNSKAIIIYKKNNKFFYKFKNYQISELKKNHILVKSLYSNINYKDKLLLHGGHGLIRKFPHIPGIDVAGRVVMSNSKKFKKGDLVYVIAKPLGILSNGGFSEYVELNSNWATKLKNKKTLKNSMIFGTNGFTAILVVKKILENKKFFKNKPILIAGSSSGTGIILTKILSKIGFEIFSSIRSLQKKKFIFDLGAKKVYDQKILIQKNEPPFLKKTYSSIIDCAGGEFINTGLKLLDDNGVYFLIGNTAGNHSKINVLPFILRGINLVGINSENINQKDREKVMKLIFKYSNDLKKHYKEFEFKNFFSALKYYSKKNNVKKILIRF